MPTRGSTAHHEPFRDILCPIDFSKPSRRALLHAATLAEQLGARVTVLYIKDPLLEIAGATTYDPSALRKATENELRRFVHATIHGSRRRGHPAIQLKIAVGDPADEIQKAARRLKSVCVVMGTHGLTGLAKVLLGSTTEKFLRLATKPVLLIPPARR